MIYLSINGNSFTGAPQELLKVFCAAAAKKSGSYAHRTEDEDEFWEISTSELSPTALCTIYELSAGWQNACAILNLTDSTDRFSAPLPEPTPEPDIFAGIRYDSY